MVKELRLNYVADDETPSLVFSYKGKYFIACYDYWNPNAIISWIDDADNPLFVHDFGSIISQNPYREFRLVNADDYKKFHDIIAYVENKMVENQAAIDKKISEAA